ncbi:MAG: sulfotransferase [Paracoccaceae bacterium]
MSSADYGFFSRLLHRVALTSPAMLRATMQMEQNRWKDEVFDDDAMAPVFICGLARSGSTLLLNRLMATGVFSASTYRHMPFVLAPNMWSGASRKHRTGARVAERAHGDGMSHSFDSEEAFEEVFWRAVGKTGGDARLFPWNAPVGAAAIEQFRGFMLSVVKAGDGARYLSKNNNNVTRIPCLLKASRTARLVVPFRDPVHFSGSTLAQHLKFLKNHAGSPFDARYMAWLGHHEFGPGFRPFAAPGVEATQEVTPDYLCRYWTAVYNALLQIDDPRLHFFDYDAFCNDPLARLSALGRVLGTSVSPTPPANVHAANRYVRTGMTDDALAMAKQVHKALRARAVGCAVV